MLTVFLLSLFRLAPIVVMPPFFGGKLLPGSTKIGFVIVLSTIFLPLIIHTTTIKLEVSVFFTALALKELLVGFFLAFFVSIPFFVVQSSGVIIDYMRGASIFQQQDPLLQNQASPFWDALQLCFDLYVLSNRWTVFVFKCFGEIVSGIAGRCSFAHTLF